MTDFGVTLEGFVEKTLEEILSELEQAQRVAFGPAIDTQADSVLGQLNGIVGNQLAELWEASLAVYRSRQPDSANGEALDNVAAITGVVRLSALPSSVTVQVNLAAATTLPLGSIARIGGSGARWVTQAAVDNPEAFPATVSVDLKSEDSAPIVGNAFAIDTIGVPVAGWSAKATKNTLNIEPFSLADGETLLVEIDAGSIQTVLFATGDFGDIANATALEVADAITAGLTNAVAVDAGGYVRLISDKEGTGSSVRITGGTSAEALAFTREKSQGFNPDVSAKIQNSSSELFALADLETLFVKVDRGVTQTVTFATGDFGDIANATAIEVAQAINSDLTGAVAYEVLGKVQIESLGTGSLGFIEVTGGTANGELSFAEGDEQGGATGDATLGRNIELDPALRLRREEVLRIAGASTVEAIRSAVRAIEDPDVLQAFVFENPTDLVDSFGRPPHSFEVVVVGGDDQVVGNTIFAVKAAGIQTFKVPGANGVSVNVTDSQSVLHVINFSRADAVEHFVEIDITVDQSLFGGGDQVAGEQQVREALKALGDTLQIGEDVVIIQFSCAALDVTGVIDVTVNRIEDVFPPVNTSNIIIAERDFATFATSDIDVNVTFA